MKLFPRLLLVLTISTAALAQTQGYQAALQTKATNLANDGDLGIMLQSIEQETQGLNIDAGKLRIEKWKADSSTRQQSAENAASIQRNINTALPELLAAVRRTPQSLAANFKLYRNLNALYDVLANLGESVGAFGKREEYETIAPHVSALDDARRRYADYLQQMTLSADNRIAAAAQQAQATAATPAPPKRIIVEDNEPAQPVKKKRAKKSTTSGSPAGTSTPK